MPATQQPWRIGPSRPVLRDGEVHVWRAELVGVAREPELCVLSDAERCRAQRILPPLRRMTWARSRALLRELLGRYLDREPADVRLCAGLHGKPELAGTMDAGRMAFSVSHSATTALYAFSAEQQVGVDVQLQAPDRHMSALADRLFGAAQARRLASLPAPRRRSEFLGGWVLLEAEVKCLGTGLAGHGASARHACWSARLPLKRGAAAVAAERHPHRIHRWRWEPRGGPQDA